jgi:hypothetical protein
MRIFNFIFRWGVPKVRVRIENVRNFKPIDASPHDFKPINAEPQEFKTIDASPRKLQ